MARTSAQYAAGLTWTTSFDAFARKIVTDTQEDVERKVGQVVREFLPKILDWMRQTAPWNNITGNARRGLRSEIEAFVGEAYVIVLDHTEPYGYWLELKNQGRYAILQPAMYYFAPQIFERLRQVLRGS